MTRNEIATMVASSGIPCAYYQFEEGSGQECPFAVFYYPSRDDFRADDANYVRITDLVVELYTDDKDFDAEDAMEAALDASGMVYKKEETYIGSERMYEVIYTMEVLIDDQE